MSELALWKRRGLAIRLALSQLGAALSPSALLVWIGRHPVAVLALATCTAGAAYWLALASDRFVSEARIVVQRTDLPGGQGTDFLGGLLGGAAPGRPDQMLLREHLLSLDMAAQLDRALNLRKHYSNRNADLLSRLWWADAPIEWLHRYLLARIHVEFDEYSGVLSIRAQAYDAQTAQALTGMLLREGETFMNNMARQLAQAQVDFLQKQVALNHERMQAARADVLAFQNRQGLLSPSGSAESITAVISKLEGQRSELSVQRAALTAYLVAGHPQVIQIDQQLAAVEQQLRTERARLTSPRGGTLNQAMEAFQRLEAQAAFTQDLYRASLTALEKGQMDANRMVKKVSVLQAAHRPEYPLEPRRVYNAAVFVAVTLLLASALKLVLLIVSEHRD